ncbi:hypothetical protein A3K63_02825 [Candidatus Micrarchaeota archaeon RBG_16_49_10]|nr:MAG: hypothetical protein A3K63_02825 [Candidatus Micrarchaeota archaeon RBG_16_49_10]
MANLPLLPASEILDTFYELQGARLSLRGVRERRNLGPYAVLLGFFPRNNSVFIEFSPELINGRPIADLYESLADLRVDGGDGTLKILRYRDFYIGTIAFPNYNRKGLD